VPAIARWKTLQDSAKLPQGTEIEIINGKKSTHKITSTGRLIEVWGGERRDWQTKVRASFRGMPGNSISIF